MRKDQILFLCFWLLILLFGYYSFNPVATDASSDDLKPPAVSLKDFMPQLPEADSAGDAHVASPSEMLSFLAQWYLDSGLNLQAKTAFEMLLEELENTKGPEHPDTLAARANLALVYQRMGDFAAAKTLYSQTLDAKERILGAEHPDTLPTRANLAVLYSEMGDYLRAKTLYLQVVEAHERILGPEHPDTMLVRSNLAGLYALLGDYAQAKTLYSQVLEAEERILGPEHPRTLITHDNMAGVYRDLGDYAQAVTLYRQTLEAEERILGPEHPDTLITRSNLAQALHWLDDNAAAGLLYSQALDDLELVLGVDHYDTMTTRSNLAGVYCDLGDYAKALEFSLRALEDHERVLGSWHPRTAATAANLSLILAKSGDRAQAVFYAKLAVEATQYQRGRQLGLENELRKNYLATVENRYHNLARLLIADGRPEEAQQVLRLLKEDELSELRRSGYGSSEKSGATARQYSIFFGVEQELRDELRQMAGDMHKQYQGQEKEKVKSPELAALEKKFHEDFTAFQNSLGERLTSGRPGILADPRRLDNVRELRGIMAKLGQGIAIIHTLSAEDTLYLFLTTPDKFQAHNRNISRKDLEKLAAEFSSLLSGPPFSDPREAARRVYDLVLAPLREDLRTEGIQTLMFSLDGALRYVPMAALHDGEKWLVQSYDITMFTEAARDNLTAEFPAKVSIEALGLTQARAGFDPLPAVKGELESIVSERSGDRGILPGVRHLDEAFNYRSLSNGMKSGTPVLHIASHFQFEPIAPSQSFLLLGDGSKLTLFNFNTDPDLPFVGIDQLTLSACQTAVGSGRGDGREVEGFGALAQARGAKSVIATLWPIADDSTAILMREFYRLRFVEKNSKAHALRLAQLALLENAGSEPGEPERAETRGILGSKTPAVSTAKARKDSGYSHPYYWAPFILMGNWK